MYSKAQTLALLLLLGFCVLSSAFHTMRPEDTGRRISFKEWKDHPWCNQPFRGKMNSRAMEIGHHTHVQNPHVGCRLEMLNLPNWKSYEDIHQSMVQFLEPNYQPDFHTHYFDDEGAVLGYHTNILLYPRPDSGMFILGLFQTSKKFPEIISNYYLKSVKNTASVWLVPKNSTNVDDTRFLIFITNEPEGMIPINTLLTPREYFDASKKKDAYWRERAKEEKAKKAKEASAHDL